MMFLVFAKSYGDGAIVSQSNYFRYFSGNMFSRLYTESITILHLTMFNFRNVTPKTASWGVSPLSLTNSLN